MNKSLIITGLFALNFGLISFAQEKTNSNTEIRKEVEMEEVNGEKVLTIRTTANGTVSAEVFKGEAADKKLAELQKEHGEAQQVREEVMVKEINGEKTVTITRTENGLVSTEVLTGTDADRKLEELKKAEATQPSTPAIKQEKSLQIERIEKKKN